MMKKYIKPNTDVQAIELQQMISSKSSKEQRTGYKPTE